jgi:hypothetical protein
MKHLVDKFYLSVKQQGLTKAIRHVSSYFGGYKRRAIFDREVLSSKEIEVRFTKIYQKNFWGSDESRSGPGSTLGASKNVRATLPIIIKDYSINTIFDAPCGDFNWMQHVLKEVNVEYVGGDIVAPLIESLSQSYSTDKIKFKHVNLVKDAFPKADLMICRDCLFHLSFDDTKSVIKNFLKSEVPLLLTTSHVNKNSFSNMDILTGDWRLIDLFSAPYTFPKDPLLQFFDDEDRFSRKQLCLFSREQVMRAFSGTLSGRL